jgi:hypothetical protein
MFREYDYYGYYGYYDITDDDVAFGNISIRVSKWRQITKKQFAKLCDNFLSFFVNKSSNIHRKIILSLLGL